MFAGAYWGSTGTTTPGGVIGGFIEAEVTASFAATLDTPVVTAVVANQAIEAIVEPNFTAEIGGDTITAEITVTEIKGEI